MATSTLPDPKSATGPRPGRSSRTRRSVLVADKAADWIIRIGGISVIIAVFGIMAFLAEVVVPLFTGGSVLSEITRDKPPTSGRILLDKMDDYRSLSVSLSESGEVSAFHIDTGRPLAAPAFDIGGGRMTAFARAPSGSHVAFGFADGTVRFGRLDVEVAVLTPDQVPANLEFLTARDRTDGTAVYSLIPGDQIRRVAVGVRLDAPQKVSESGIVAIDYRIGGTIERPSKTFVTVDAEGTGRMSRAETRMNLLTGGATDSIDTAVLPALPQGLVVADILVTEQADQVYVAERGGMVYRYDTRNFASPVLAERLDMFPGAGELTVFGFLIGEQSIVVGGSDGTLNVYFRLPSPGSNTADGYVMVLAHKLERHGAAVLAMDISQRGKTLVTADAGGQVWVRHSTSEQTLLKLTVPDRAMIEALALSPRDDGVLAITDNGRYHAWAISIPHPETTFGSIFGKVWYEGYPEPTYTWQSSSGNDSFEPKLSLVPLIFGTIKATFYSLLFAVPIALCAAIYTSEFVHSRVRAVVKPTMEMMASLPSVVLGFIAALILAPIVETWIAAVILAFVALPLGLLIGAYLWQLLPERLALRFGGLPKFALMFVAIAAAVYAAKALGPAFEHLVFAGDLRAWANGDAGSDLPFMTLLLLPLGFLAANAVFQRSAADGLRDMLSGRPRPQAGLIDIGRWLLLLALAGLISYLMSLVLVGIGLGVRGGMVDTYVQRNTLVVGFAMGFAVIPIIYTIAEDALNAVPEHLRAASLACGATPWQTAVSVILPTAMSGVFAAVMVGMGRAVGETMIVVMAAGNTPLMDWNIFNGLRALSANIAVELPEAVKDGTLYRMLFLAALTLFVATFVINTGAEVIRQRFRKRAAQL